MSLKCTSKLGVVMHFFKSNIRKQRQVDLRESEASLWIIDNPGSLCLKINKIQTAVAFIFMTF